MEFLAQQDTASNPLLPVIMIIVFVAIPTLGVWFFYLIIKQAIVKGVKKVLKEYDE